MEYLSKLIHKEPTIIYNPPIEIIASISRVIILDIINYYKKTKMVQILNLTMINKNMAVSIQKNLRSHNHQQNIIKKVCKNQSKGAINQRKIHKKIENQHKILLKSNKKLAKRKLIILKKIWI
jgi:hypothetical protein